jgi:F-type H+-transporting ATPase subunit delta
LTLTSGSIPRRYARALLAIGVDTRLYEKLGAELDSFAVLLRQKDLLQALTNPSIAHSRRKAVVEELIARQMPTAVVRSFLLLLVDRNRIELLPHIAREYQGLADAHAGRVRAEVASAEPLAGESLSRLKRALEQKTGKQVVLEQRTDPELIAGMVTRVGSIIYDGSIRTRLEQLRRTLLEHET